MILYICFAHLSFDFLSLWDNPSVHCEYVLLSLANKKKTVWPIARQDKVRWDKQTEDAGIKKG